MILFLDEPDLLLHPRWQKNYINELLNLLSEFSGKKLHIIITSHSPFILSDLPKENVIFLEKYTKKEIDNKHLDQQVGNCKNATKNVNINSFGANIHTLLSHGFFMKDGLMGEFAKGKINEVIQILKRKRVSKKNLNYCQNIISAIGEPILKKTLEDKLHEKLLPRETKLKILQNKQKEIEAEIEALQKESL